MAVEKTVGDLREILLSEKKTEPGSLQVPEHQHIKTEDEMAEVAKLDKNERYYHRTDEQLAQFAGWKPEFEKA